MLIKICGIKRSEAAQAAANAGADMIGLVFAESRRQVTVEEAKVIRESCSSFPVQFVGVFRNQPISEVNTISEAVGLDFVQLHGQESLKKCRQVKAPLIRALSHDEVKAGSPFAELSEYMLIDSPKPGGGQPFDWSDLKRDRPAFPFILAGGLSIGNIAEALQAAEPLGVDVSSGVETDGEKDEKKIRDFIEEVRRLEID
ncbi:MAG: phosphoribosylanthranilate isomerase [Alkalibacterium sp.]|nr:phosphoribosylanthranilate isomerase [Alkalibacterium sp.]